MVLGKQGAKGVCVDVQGVPASRRKADFMTLFSMHVITEGLLEQFIKQMQR